MMRKYGGEQAVRDYDRGRSFHSAFVGGLIAGEFPVFRAAGLGLKGLMARFAETGAAKAMAPLAERVNAIHGALDPDRRLKSNYSRFGYNSAVEQVGTSAFHFLMLAEACVSDKVRLGSISLSRLAHWMSCSWRQAKGSLWRRSATAQCSNVAV